MKRKLYCENCLKDIKLKKIYSGNRQKAYTILKENHKEEYTFILSELMHNEYLRRRKLKGGYKE
jgi:hypothetical protein